MEPNRVTAKDVLSAPISFPNAEAGERLSDLVGLDGHVESINRDLQMIFDPGFVEAWSERHYGKLLPAVRIAQDAVPLIVFEGDVGTGKTALAEVIGQRVAEEGSYGVHLVKMSTQVRGTGYVGEMGTLLAESFKYVEAQWKKLGEPIIFIIDEADSLLTSRASLQHHHEDKSGVNTILQHLDAFRNGRAQVAVIAITNRVGVLDPAVRRRTTAVYSFGRPDESQRGALLRRLFGSALSELDFMEVMAASRPKRLDGQGCVPYTYSDLTLRFAVPALREAAWDDKPLQANVLKAVLARLSPTPPMSNNATERGGQRQ